MGTDYKGVYARDPERYDRLICREDCDGNLGRAIEALVDLAGARIVDVGAGTGRLTCFAARRGASGYAFDQSPAMLEIARARLRDIPGAEWNLGCAEAEALPVSSRSADYVWAAWVFGHAVEWFPTEWKTRIDRYLSEMERVLTPGGTMMIVETLGTGRTTPEPPNAGLADYYRWLEEQRGFERVDLRTDYLFESRDEALLLLGSFFGEERSRTMIPPSGCRVPECSGLWWKKNSPR